MKKVIAKLEKNKIRLDSYIKEILPDLSRVTIQRWIENGNILINSKKVKPSYKISNGEEITIEAEKAKEIEIIGENIPLDIVYEDSDIIVINKEKGIVVHPGAGNPNRTLVNAVLYHCKDSLSGIGGELRPGIVHRLDKDTSGLIIIAKNDKAHINMAEQISNREVKKTYLTLVRGIIEENVGTINMPIARNTKDRLKMAVAKDGKEAVTHFEVLKRFERIHLY